MLDQHYKIAISVDMHHTAIDVTEVLNLVFFLAPPAPPPGGGVVSDPVPFCQVHSVSCVGVLLHFSLAFEPFFAFPFRSNS